MNVRFGAVKLAALAISGLILVAISVRAASQVAGSWVPRIACAHPEIDLGEVLADQVVRSEFVVANTGRRKLVIHDVLGGCSRCVTVSPTSAKIAPGETAVLTATLDARKLSGNEERKTILVQSNDPAQPHVRLSMRCRVVRAIEAVPDTVTLQRDANGHWSAASVEVLPRDPQTTFHILDLAKEVPNIKATWTPLANRNGYRLEVTAQPTLNTARLQKLLIVKTDHSQAPEVRIRLRTSL
jgi:hypothetical protein